MAKVRRPGAERGAKRPAQGQQSHGRPHQPTRGSKQGRRGSGDPLPDRNRLDHRLAEWAPALDVEVRGRLVDYLVLAAHWNQTYNLIGDSSDDELTNHVLDCLSVELYMLGPRILDIGTGAGLPGIVLALVRPDLEWVLLDRRGKKTRFCLHAVTALNLENVQVVREDAADYVPGALFDSVVSRATMRLAPLWAVAVDKLRSGGSLVAMKAAVTPEEVSELVAKGLHVTVQPLQVPGLTVERNAVIVKS